MRRGRVLLALAALTAAGCGVRQRDDLVGEYTRKGAAETWSLRDDGTCEVRSSLLGDVTACEWLYVEETFSRKVVITLHRDPARHGGVAQVVRYTLTPSRWPGQAITLPLGDREVLERRR